MGPFLPFTDNPDNLYRKLNDELQFDMEGHCKVYKTANAPVTSEEPDPACDNLRGGSVHHLLCSSAVIDHYHPSSRLLITPVDVTVCVAV